MGQRFFTMFVAVVGVVLLVGLPTGAAAQDEAPDSFGPNVHFLNISAEEFQLSIPPNTPYVYWDCQDGYWCTASGDPVATVRLPAGAKILGFRIFFEDIAATGWFTFKLKKKWNQGDQRGTETLVTYMTEEAESPGITEAWVDVDPDVTVRYRVWSGSSYLYSSYYMVFNTWGSFDFRFSHVLISWVREVSPAPATATFADVPTGHPFFPFVEALAASGITAGCGGGNYCPDDPVTRGQMAVYLAAALGLHWES